MLTPQEVSNHAFAKAVMGGYNMAMVDEFLDELTDDYTSLYKENAALKAKMKVLVDKVEEYRSTEDAMRAALLTAQKMADSMVAEAEEKKKSLLENAESEANRKICALRDEVAQEERRLTAAKAETADFLARVRELYEREMKLLEELPEADLAPAAPLELAKPAADISEIEKSIMDSFKLPDLTKAAEVEPEAEEAPEAPEESPEECLLREAKEETGLTLTSWQCRGVVTFLNATCEGEYMYLFTADAFEGELTDCPEGDLRWVSREFLNGLPKWEGDQIFLDLLWQDAPFFLLTLRYHGDTLTEAILNGKKIR